MTDEGFVKDLLDAMDKKLISQSTEIAFLLLRVASEGFIVGQCALAVNEALRKANVGGYRLYLEKHPSGKRPDLALVPLNPNGSERSRESIIFEFKTGWPGWAGCGEAVRDDLTKWQGMNERNRVFAVAFVYCFDTSLYGWPYAYWPKGVEHSNGLDNVRKRIADTVGCKPFWQGTPFPLIRDDAKGVGQLVAWRE